MKIDQKLKDKIANVLNKKGAIKPCQRCGHGNFIVLDGFANIPLSQELSGNVVIGGPTVPCAVIACNNCGNISYHALGALGLLNENMED